jgi:hypothetical protein
VTSYLNVFLPSFHGQHTDYPLDLAMTFAKFSEQLREELTTESEHFMNYAEAFENMACDMLEECNSEAEVELILRQTSAQRLVI